MNETPNSQFLLNIAFAFAGVASGWVMKLFYDRLHDLEIRDNAIADKVQAIELLVAGEYVKKDQLERMEEALFKKLDKIEDLLNKKVDK